jgi:branched-chain amino acid transport system permease protein
MALLGGVHSLIGPTLGAIVVGAGLEYFKNDYGDTQLHLVALGLLLVVIVLFLPDGIAPAVSGWIRRLGPQAASIRESTQEQLAAERAGSAS